MRLKISFKIFGIIICILLQIYYLYYLNHWRGEFWQQINDRNNKEFWHMIIKFSYAAFILVYSGAAMTWLISKVSLDFRTMVTKIYILRFCEKFITNDGMKGGTNTIDNPEERLCTDLTILLTGVLNLFSGVLLNFGRFLVFSGVIIMISREIWHVPYTLLLGTIGYSVLGVLIAVIVARKLLITNYDNKKTEASFRFGLSAVRLTETTEPLENHFKRFSDLQQNNLKLFTQIKILNIFTGTYSQASVIIPILFLAPAYFNSPWFTFGLLMQAIGAFGEATDSLSYLTNNWQAFMEIKACLLRWKEFSGVFTKKNEGIQ